MQQQIKSTNLFPLFSTLGFFERSLIKVSHRAENLRFGIYILISCWTPDCLVTTATMHLLEIKACLTCIWGAFRRRSSTVCKVMSGFYKSRRNNLWTASNRLNHIYFINTQKISENSPFPTCSFCLTPIHPISSNLEIMWHCLYLLTSTRLWIPLNIFYLYFSYLKHFWKHYINLINVIIKCFLWNPVIVSLIFIFSFRGPKVTKLLENKYMIEWIRLLIYSLNHDIKLSFLYISNAWTDIIVGYIFSSFWRCWAAIILTLTSARWYGLMLL